MQTTWIRLRRRVTHRLNQIQAIWNLYNIFTNFELHWSTVNIEAEEKFSRRQFKRINSTFTHRTSSSVSELFFRFRRPVSTFGAEMGKYIDWATFCKNGVSLLHYPWRIEVLFISYSLSLSKALVITFLLLVFTDIICVNVSYVVRNEFSARFDKK